jgi:hypothetical protein
MSDDSHATAKTYPLCWVRDELDAHDLTSYRSEIDRKAPKLFVPGEEYCRIELREHVNHAVEEGGDGGQEGCQPHSAWLPRSVNSAVALQAVLNVKKPVPRNPILGVVC